VPEFRFLPATTTTADHLVVQLVRGLNLTVLLDEKLARTFEMASLSFSTQPEALLFFPLSVESYGTVSPAAAPKPFSVVYRLVTKKSAFGL
jgi:hypothetical protein